MKQSRLSDVFSPQLYNKINIDEEVIQKILRKTIYNKKGSIFARVAVYLTPVMAIFVVFFVIFSYILPDKYSSRSNTDNHEMIQMLPSQPKYKIEGMQENENNFNSMMEPEGLSIASDIEDSEMSANDVGVNSMRAMKVDSTINSESSGEVMESEIFSDKPTSSDGIYNDTISNKDFDAKGFSNKMVKSDTYVAGIGSVNDNKDKDVIFFIIASTVGLIVAILVFVYIMKPKYGKK